MSNFETSTSSASDGQLVNWNYLWVVAVRHYRLFLWVFIPIILLTIGYLVITKPLYESTAVVQVNQREHSAIDVATSPDDTQDLTSEDSVKTIEQNMQSYDLFEAVVRLPEVANDPDFRVGYSGDGTPAELADWLRDNTTIALRHGTRLIDVSVYHRVPRMAQKLAEALVVTYVTVGNQLQSNEQQSSVKLLSSESSGVKGSLQAAEQSLETYKDLLDLKTRIDTQQATVDQLKERYREKHPQMIEARALLAQLNHEFDDEFQKTVANPVNRAATAFVNDPNDGFEDRVSAETRYVQARAQVLQKEVDTESDLFNSLLKQENDASVGEDATATPVELVEPPQLSNKPAKPKKSIILLLGFSMATFLGIGAVLGVRVLDSTIDTPMEAEAALGLPVIGTILRASGKKSKEKDSTAGAPARLAVNPGGLPDELVVMTDAGSATAEGFRSLRAVINLLGKPAENRTILFTSALPGEGKTYVSCNYALSLSMTGVRTLLIDTDLRRPAVHERIKIDNKVGLVELLTQDAAELSQVVHAKVAKNFDVLTAGGPCNNPAELLAGNGFRLVLAKALASYDRIVVDTGPVNLVSDCLLVAPEVSMVCFVLRAGSTARQAPKHAINLLRRAQKEPTGIILNAIPPGGDRLYLGYKGRGGTGSYGNVYG
jgi:polysaccharide biosynthesis transport protein